VFILICPKGMWLRFDYIMLKFQSYIQMANEIYGHSIRINYVYNGSVEFNFKLRTLHYDFIKW